MNAIRTPFDMRNQVRIEAADTTAEAILVSVESITDAMVEYDRHIANTTSNAHSISNISGLASELNSKQDNITGYSGTLTVVTGVNFADESTTTKTITFSNGVVKSVI